MLGAWATDKPVSWVAQAVFTEVPKLLWLHIGVQSVYELFHTSWILFGCLLKLTGFWKIQIMVPSYLFEKHIYLFSYLFWKERGSEKPDDIIVTK